MHVICRKALIVSAVLAVSIPFLNAAFAADKAGTLNVVMLGDSTTLCVRSKKGDKLTDCVQKSLEAALAKSDIKVSVINSGKGSDTAAGGYKRLEKDVFSHNPHVVTVSFGLNDTGLLTPAQFKDHLEKIVLAVRSKSKAKVLLVTSTPFDNGRHAWRNKFMEKGGLDEYMDKQICDGMRAVARKHKAPLCDLHTQFKNEFRKNPKLIKKIIRPDGVHLTEAGNAMAARYLTPMIYTALTGKKLEAGKDKAQ